MKLPVILLFSVLASSTAFATKARLQALGEGTSGSFFLNDDRNVLLNPANIHRVPTSVIVEWGAAGAATTQTDAVGTPKAEGALYQTGDGMLWGMYLGEENTTVVRHRNTGNNALLKPDNTITGVYGQKTASGIKWGTSVTFSKNQQEAAFKRTENLILLKGGAVLKSRTDVFAHLKLIDEADGAAAKDDKYKADTGFVLGATHPMPGYDIFGVFTSQAFDYETGGTSTDFSEQIIALGAAKKFNPTENAMYFYKAQFLMNNSKAGKAKMDTQTLNLSLGVEQQANEWLALRASVTQNALINSTKADPGTAGAKSTTSSTADTTTVNAGLSVGVGNYKFDGLFTTGGGTLNGNNIMSRVGMAYKF